MKKLSIFLAFLLFVAFQAAAQMQTTGTVTGDDGLSIPGVSVVVKSNPLIGTTTDIDGKYSLTVPSDAQILVFSFVGMTTKEETIGGRSVIDVVLQADVLEMEEVVVIGYGLKKQGSISGSVATLKADKLEQIPVTSFDNMLQGRTSGVLALSSSGEPGSEATIRIRGLNSINASSDPLIIIDGIPVQPDDFSAYNPNDFASYDILKDASATSIYGARAANGVIYITTKRGRNQETEFNLRTLYGYDKLARDKFEMMNTTEKLDYEEMLGIRTAGTYNRDSLENINTNWLDETLEDAVTKSIELSARGGNKKTRFYTSGSYFYKDGILPRSEFDRYSFRLNLDHDATSKIKMGTSLALGYETASNTVSGTGFTNNIYNPVFSARLINPYSKVYDENGEYTSDGLPWANPIEQLHLNERSNNQLKIIGNIFAQYEIIKNLKYKSSLSIDYLDYTFYRYLHPESAWGSATDGIIYKEFQRETNISFSNTLNYEFSVSDINHFNVVVGHETIQDKYEAFDVSANTLPNDKVRVLDATAEINAWGGGINEWSVQSFFGALNYDFDNKYFIDLSLRSDGCSRFSEDNRYGTFWSVGLAWDILQENFFSLPWLNTLKLSGSYGTAGNYEIGDYRWRQLYAYNVSYNDLNGSRPSEPGNQDLTWEKVAKTNIALDLGIFERASLKLQWYKNITSDMLYEVPLSYTTGFESGFRNVVEMSNTGFEVELDLDIIKGKDFIWSFNTNFAYNKNQIEKLYGDVEEIVDGNIIIKPGYSYGTFYQVRYAGVNPANGNPMWLTEDGQLTEVYSEDNSVILEGKSYLPPYTGGFTNTFSYKGFELSTFFSWMKDKYMFNNTRYFIESNGQFASYNQSKKMLDYWQQPGDITDVPSPFIGASYFDSHLVEDASFLRLKTITLSYSLPQNILERLVYIKGLRIYAIGQNLWTLTDYEGIDPEYYGITELNAYPQPKTYSLGLDIKF